MWLQTGLWLTLGNDNRIPSDHFQLNDQPALDPGIASPLPYEQHEMDEPDHQDVDLPVECRRSEFDNRPHVLPDEQAYPIARDQTDSRWKREPVHCLSHHSQHRQIHNRSQYGEWDWKVRISDMVIHSFIYCIPNKFDKTGGQSCVTDAVNNYLTLAHEYQGQYPGELVTKTRRQCNHENNRLDLRVCNVITME